MEHNFSFTGRRIDASGNAIIRTSSDDQVLGTPTGSSGAYGADKRTLWWKRNSSYRNQQQMQNDTETESTSLQSSFLTHGANASPPFHRRLSPTHASHAIDPTKERARQPSSTGNNAVQIRFGGLGGGVVERDDDSDVFVPTVQYVRPPKRSLFPSQIKRPSAETDEDSLPLATSSSAAESKAPSKAGTRYKAQRPPPVHTGAKAVPTGKRSIQEKGIHTTGKAASNRPQLSGNLQFEKSLTEPFLGEEGRSVSSMDTGPKSLEEWSQSSIAEGVSELAKEPKRLKLLESQDARSQAAVEKLRSDIKSRKDSEQQQQMKKQFLKRLDHDIRAKNRSYTSSSSRSFLNDTKNSSSSSAEARRQAMSSYMQRLDHKTGSAPAQRRKPPVPKFRDIGVPKSGKTQTPPSSQVNRVQHQPQPSKQGEKEIARPPAPLKQASQAPVQISPRASQLPHTPISSRLANFMMDEEKAEEKREKIKAYMKSQRAQRKQQEQIEESSRARADAKRREQLLALEEYRRRQFADTDNVPQRSPEAQSRPLPSKKRGRTLNEKPPADKKSRLNTSSSSLVEGRGSKREKPQADRFDQLQYEERVESLLNVEDYFMNLGEERFMEAFRVPDRQPEVAPSTLPPSVRQEHEEEVEVFAVSTQTKQTLEVTRTMAEVNGDGLNILGPSRVAEERTVQRDTSVGEQKRERTEEVPSGSVKRNQMSTAQLLKAVGDLSVRIDGMRKLREEAAVKARAARGREQSVAAPLPNPAVRQLEEKIEQLTNRIAAMESERAQTLAQTHIYSSPTHDTDASPRLSGQLSSAKEALPAATQSVESEMLRAQNLKRGEDELEARGREEKDVNPADEQSPIDEGEELWASRDSVSSQEDMFHIGVPKISLAAQAKMKELFSSAQETGLLDNVNREWKETENSLLGYQGSILENVPSFDWDKESSIYSSEESPSPLASRRSERPLMEVAESKKEHATPERKPFTRSHAQQKSPALSKPVQQENISILSQFDVVGGPGAKYEDAFDDVIESIFRFHSGEEPRGREQLRRERPSYRERPQEEKPRLQVKERERVRQAKGSRKPVKSRAKPFAESRKAENSRGNESWLEEMVASARDPDPYSVLNILARELTEKQMKERKSAPQKKQQQGQLRMANAKENATAKFSVDSKGQHSKHDSAVSSAGSLHSAVTVPSTAPASISPTPTAPLSAMSLDFASQSAQVKEKSREEAAEVKAVIDVAEELDWSEIEEDRDLSKPTQPDTERRHFSKSSARSFPQQESDASRSQRGAQAKDRERNLSPSSLHRQLLAELRLQEALHHSELQLQALQYSQALASAQEETVAVARQREEEQLRFQQAEELIMQQQAHEEDMRTLTERIRAEIEEAQMEQLAVVQEDRANLVDQIKALSKRDSGMQTDVNGQRTIGTEAALMVETSTAADDEDDRRIYSAIAPSYTQGQQTEPEHLARRWGMVDRGVMSSPRSSEKAKPDLRISHMESISIATSEYSQAPRSNLIVKDNRAEASEDEEDYGSDFVEEEEEEKDRKGIVGPSQIQVPVQDIPVEEESGSSSIRSETHRSETSLRVSSKTLQVEAEVSELEEESFDYEAKQEQASVASADTASVASEEADLAIESRQAGIRQTEEASMEIDEDDLAVLAAAKLRQNALAAPPEEDSMEIDEEGPAALTPKPKTFIGITTEDDIAEESGGSVHSLSREKAAEPPEEVSGGSVSGGEYSQEFSQSSESNKEVTTALASSTGRIEQPPITPPLPASTSVGFFQPSHASRLFSDDPIPLPGFPELAGLQASDDIVTQFLKELKEKQKHQESLLNLRKRALDEITSRQMKLLEQQRLMLKQRGPDVEAAEGQLDLLAARLELSYQAKIAEIKRERSAIAAQCYKELLDFQEQQLSFQFFNKDEDDPTAKELQSLFHSMLPQFSLPGFSRLPGQPAIASAALQPVVPSQPVAPSTAVRLAHENLEASYGDEDFVEELSAAEIEETQRPKNEGVRPIAEDEGPLEEISDRAESSHSASKSSARVEIENFTPSVAEEAEEKEQSRAKDVAIEESAEIQEEEGAYEPEEQADSSSQPATERSKDSYNDDDFAAVEEVEEKSKKEKAQEVPKELTSASKNVDEADEEASVSGMSVGMLQVEDALKATERETSLGKGKRLAKRQEHLQTKKAKAEALLQAKEQIIATRTKALELEVEAKVVDDIVTKALQLDVDREIERRRTELQKAYGEKYKPAEEAAFPPLPRSAVGSAMPEHMRVSPPPSRAAQPQQQPPSAVSRPVENDTIESESSGYSESFEQSTARELKKPKEEEQEEDIEEDQSAAETAEEAEGQRRLPNKQAEAAITEEDGIADEFEGPTASITAKTAVVQAPMEIEESSGGDYDMDFEGEGSGELKTQSKKATPSIPPAPASVGKSSGEEYDNDFESSSYGGSLGSKSKALDQLEGALKAVQEALPTSTQAVEPSTLPLQPEPHFLTPMAAQPSFSNLDIKAEFEAVEETSLSVDKELLESIEVKKERIETLKKALAEKRHAIVKAKKKNEVLKQRQKLAEEEEGLERELEQLQAQLSEQQQIFGIPPELAEVSETAQKTAVRASPLEIVSGATSVHIEAFSAEKPSASAAPVQFTSSRLLEIASEVSRVHIEDTPSMSPGGSIAEKDSSLRQAPFPALESSTEAPDSPLLQQKEKSPNSLAVDIALTESGEEPKAAVVVDRAERTFDSFDYWEDAEMALEILAEEGTETEEVYMSLPSPPPQVAVPTGPSWKEQVTEEVMAHDDSFMSSTSESKTKDATPSAAEEEQRVVDNGFVSQRAQHEDEEGEEHILLTPDSPLSVAQELELGESFESSKDELEMSTMVAGPIQLKADTKKTTTTVAIPEAETGEAESSLSSVLSHSFASEKSALFESPSSSQEGEEGLPSKQEAGPSIVEEQPRAAEEGTFGAVTVAEADAADSFGSSHNLSTNLESPTSLLPAEKESSKARSSSSEGSFNSAEEELTARESNLPAKEEAKSEDMLSGAVDLADSFGSELSKTAEPSHDEPMQLQQPGDEGQPTQLIAEGEGLLDSFESFEESALGPAVSEPMQMEESSEKREGLDDLSYDYLEAALPPTVAPQQEESSQPLTPSLELGPSTGEVPLADRSVLVQVGMAFWKDFPGHGRFQGVITEVDPPSVFVYYPEDCDEEELTVDEVLVLLSQQESSPMTEEGIVLPDAIALEERQMDTPPLEHSEDLLKSFDYRESADLPLVEVPQINYEPSQALPLQKEELALPLARPSTVFAENTSLERVQTSSHTELFEGRHEELDPSGPSLATLSEAIDPKALGSMAVALKSSENLTSSTAERQEESLAIAPSEAKSAGSAVEAKNFEDSLPPAPKAEEKLAHATPPLPPFSESSFAAANAEIPRSVSPAPPKEEILTVQMEAKDNAHKHLSESASPDDLLRDFEYVEEAVHVDAAPRSREGSLEVEKEEIGGSAVPVIPDSPEQSEVLTESSSIHEKATDTSIALSSKAIEETPDILPLESKDHSDSFDYWEDVEMALPSISAATNPSSTYNAISADDFDYWEDVDMIPLASTTASSVTNAMREGKSERALPHVSTLPMQGNAQFVSETLPLDLPLPPATLPPAPSPTLTGDESLALERKTEDLELGLPPRPPSSADSRENISSSLRLKEDTVPIALPSPSVSLEAQTDSKTQEVVQPLILQRDTNSYQRSYRFSSLASNEEAQSFDSSVPEIKASREEALKLPSEALGSLEVPKLEEEQHKVELEQAAGSLLASELFSETVDEEIRDVAVLARSEEILLRAGLPSDNLLGDYDYVEISQPPATDSHDEVDRRENMLSTAKLSPKQEQLKERIDAEGTERLRKNLEPEPSMTAKPNVPPLSRTDESATRGSTEEFVTAAKGEGSSIDQIEDTDVTPLDDEKPLVSVPETEKKPSGDPVRGFRVEEEDALSAPLSSEEAASYGFHGREVDHRQPKSSPPEEQLAGFDYVESCEPAAALSTTTTRDLLQPTSSVSPPLPPPSSPREGMEILETPTERQETLSSDHHHYIPKKSEISREPLLRENERGSIVPSEAKEELPLVFDKSIPKDAGTVPSSVPSSLSFTSTEEVSPSERTEDAPTRPLSLPSEDNLVGFDHVESCEPALAPSTALQKASGDLFEPISFVSASAPAFTLHSYPSLNPSLRQVGEDIEGEPSLLVRPLPSSTVKSEQTAPSEEVQGSIPRSAGEEVERREALTTAFDDNTSPAQSSETTVLHTARSQTLTISAEEKEGSVAAEELETAEEANLLSLKEDTEVQSEDYAALPADLGVSEKAEEESGKAEAKASSSVLTSPEERSQEVNAAKETAIESKDVSLAPLEAEHFDYIEEAEPSSIRSEREQVLESSLLNTDSPSGQTISSEKRKEDIEGAKWSEGVESPFSPPPVFQDAAIAPPQSDISSKEKEESMGLSEPDSFDYMEAAESPAREGGVSWPVSTSDTIENEQTGGKADEKALGREWEEEERSLLLAPIAAESSEQQEELETVKVATSSDADEDTTQETPQSAPPQSKEPIEGVSQAKEEETESPPPSESRRDRDRLADSSLPFEGDAKVPENAEKQEREESASSRSDRSKKREELVTSLTESLLQGLLSGLSEDVSSFVGAVATRRGEQAVRKPEEKKENAPDKEGDKRRFEMEEQMGAKKDELSALQEESSSSDIVESEPKEVTKEQQVIEMKAEEEAGKDVGKAKEDDSSLLHEEKQVSVPTESRNVPDIAEEIRTFSQELAEEMTGLLLEESFDVVVDAKLQSFVKKAREREQRESVEASSSLSPMHNIPFRREQEEEDEEELWRILQEAEKENDLSAVSVREPSDINIHSVSDDTVLAELPAASGASATPPEAERDSLLSSRALSITDEEIQADLERVVSFDAVLVAAQERTDYNWPQIARQYALELLQNRDLVDVVMNRPIPDNDYLLDLSLFMDIEAEREHQFRQKKFQMYGIDLSEEDLGNLQVLQMRNKAIFDAINAILEDMVEKYRYSRYSRPRVGTLARQFSQFTESLTHNALRDEVMEHLEEKNLFRANSSAAKTWREIHQQSLSSLRTAREAAKQAVAHKLQQAAWFEVDDFPVKISVSEILLDELLDDTVREIGRLMEGRHRARQS